MKSDPAAAVLLHGREAVAARLVIVRQRGRVEVVVVADGQVAGGEAAAEGVGDAAARGAGAGPARGAQRDVSRKMQRRICVSMCMRVRPGNALGGGARERARQQAA